MTKGHCRSCISFCPGIDGIGWCERHRAKYRALGHCEDYAPVYDERHGRPSPDARTKTRKDRT
jgi:hypothetical protein